MVGTNLENLYGFSPTAYRDVRPGGLRRILEEAMHEQDLQRRDDYLAGGLYGRMFPSKSEHEFPGASIDRGKTTHRSLDPNFRQLVRISTTVQPQGVPGGSGNSSDQSDTVAARPLEQLSSASAIPSDRPLPVLAGFRLSGRKVPLSPVGGEASHSIPAPRVPDAWGFAWPLLRILPEVARGLAVGEEFGSDQKADREVDGEPLTVPRTTQERSMQARPKGASVEPPGRMPPNNDRGPQSGIAGLPLWLERRQRQSPSTSDGGQSSEQQDPDFRQISRSPARSERFDDPLDIPEFLRRQSQSETTTVSPEKPPSNSWQKSRYGNGNWGNGNGGGGGGGSGGGDGYDEECKEMRRKAHEICVDAFANGTIGDIVKRWRSPYATGPFSKASGKWTIADCKKGLIGEACDGGDYERPPEPAERQKRAKEELARRRKR